MRPRVLWSVARTAFREFIRTPEAVFWTYGFPIVMAIGLGIAFAHGEAAPVRAVVLAQSAQDAVYRALLEEPRFEVERLAADDAKRALALGEFDVLVGGSVKDPIVEVDLTRPQAELALFWVERALGREVGRDVEPRAVIKPVTEKGSRYIDFLIPGLIGINLLGAGMYGIGFNLVHMRVGNLLRRLYVTPMAPLEFLTAFLMSRLVLVVPEALFVVAFGALAFDVPVNGSILLVALVVLIGGIAMSGLGLLVSCRARTVESVSGLINLVTLPMWLLGGSFFNNDRFPEVVQPVIQLLPLSLLNDALRAVMLGGAGLFDVANELLLLGAIATLCIGLALKLFRWA